MLAAADARDRRLLSVTKSSVDATKDAATETIRTATAKVGHRQTGIPMKAASTSLERRGESLQMEKMATIKAREVY